MAASAGASVLALVALAAAIPVLGCGSDDTSGSVDPLRTPPAADEPDSYEEPEPEPSDGLEEVGTVVTEGDGTTFTVGVSVRPITYGTDGAPPQEVLDACSPGYVLSSTTLAASAYVNGEYEMSYDQGRLPTSAGLGGHLTQYESFYVTALVAMKDPDGQWHCGSGPSFTFDPGESTTSEFWAILLNVLNNANPEFSPDDLSTLQFDLLLTGSQIPAPRRRTETISGPKAAICNTSDEIAILFPYAELPFTADTREGGVISCEAAG